MIPGDKKCFMILLIMVAVVIGLVILYRLDPSVNRFYPRCLFFVLTGWQCPGCGTLRALYCLMHGRFADAWRFNGALVILLPMLVLLLALPRLSKSSVMGWVILAVIVIWWIGRNVFPLLVSP